METSFYIEEYAKLTKSQRDLCRVLYKHEIAFQKGKYDRVRLKRATLAKYSKCCIKTVSRFNQSVRSFLIAVLIKWKANGHQGANEYVFDPEFFRAMHLMERKNILYKDTKIILNFANSHRQNQNVPLTHPKCPSSYTSSSFTDSKEYQGVHSYIEKIGGLSHQQRLSLSQYPEYAIVSGVDDCVWYCRQGNRPDNLYALIQSRIKKRTSHDKRKR